MAWAAGIRAFDTAPHYGAGLSERRIGEFGVTLAAAALQFTLHHPAVTAAVIGARTAEEITVDVSYLETRIPDVLWAELTQGNQPYSSLGLGNRILPDQ